MESNWTLEPQIGLRSPNLTNTTVNLQDSSEIQLEDVNWILTCSFIIFSVQTGFGLLESGCVSVKNEVSIMMKNLADISLGGLSYWIFGYGMSFGTGPLSNPVVGVGNFLVDPPVGDALMGPVFTSFLFQLSFATKATTIVSGAMAERCNFKAYCVFSFLNTIVYCVPAGWVWGAHGFLNKLGAVDIAGSGPVHLIGGASAFAAALMLGPRLGRYARGTAPLPLGNPVNVVMGTFMLWWAWLAFNSGSTYGVSGAKWQYAARAAVMTMMASIGGGCFGLLFTLVKNRGRADVMELINSILGSLVSISAGCFLFRAWESLVVGVIGAAVASAAAPLIDRMRVDDPVGSSAVHGACGFWGVIAVGLFADNPIPILTTNGRSGLFKGGGWYLLGVQTLAAVCLLAWGALVTLALLWLIDKVLPIRMDPYEELLGADFTEHMIPQGEANQKKHDMKLQIFSNNAFVGDEYDSQPSTFKNNGQPGSQENKLHMTQDSMVHEIDGANFKKRKGTNSSNPNKNGGNQNKDGGVSVVHFVPEELKGRKFKEFNVAELEELGEMNTNHDRFRRRFTEDDYKKDVMRANIDIRSLD